MIVFCPLRHQALGNEGCFLFFSRVGLVLCEEFRFCSFILSFSTLVSMLAILAIGSLFFLQEFRFAFVGACFLLAMPTLPLLL